MNDNSVHIAARVAIPFSEIFFQTSRSSGPGGQNVNKLETRVELLFDLKSSPSIPDDIKQRLLLTLSSQLDSSGTLRIVCQESRSQWKNKQLALDKFKLLLKKTLIVPKTRKRTRPTKSARENRLTSKRLHSEKKRLRKTDLE